MIDDQDLHRRALREARIKAHEALVRLGLVPVGIEGEPIDRMAELRDADRRAIASYERWRESV